MASNARRLNLAARYASIERVVMFDELTEVHLRAAGVSVVVTTAGGTVPRIRYWGPDLGPLDDQDLTQLALAGTSGAVDGGPDDCPEVAVIPEHAAGWQGSPGVLGHRAGAAWSPRFTCHGMTVTTEDHTRGGRIVATGTDDAAGIRISIELELLASGLLRQRADLVVPDGVDGEYVVDGLALTVPVPPVATELLDLAGRWGRERAPQRASFPVGLHARENRRGRTGADAPLNLAAGTPGFGFRSGEVWAVHVAWSGNHRCYAERTAEGVTLLGGGELLLPGEIRLCAGQHYTSPWFYAAYATGLDGVASRFHEHLRTAHPVAAPPVVLNTWEAMYYRHDPARLVELARLAAEVGVERYVLDDGWFRNRRDDTAGLGDWYVDETRWPGGLAPLVNTVRELGMDFGLWVEPEMISPDSDLGRAHPEWIMSASDRNPPLARHQQVLDLARPEAYEYILRRMDALLTELDVSYLKWDHNRDLVDAGHGAAGTAGVHQQTVAVYRLLDELRARHPDVAIESCSSGGGRIDLAILERTQRVWASDCLDPLERQAIQRWTGQLVPPERIGAHIGAPRSDTTGRTHDLAFRAGTALFASMGIEWDLTTATAADRAELAAWVALFKDVRHLVCDGDVVRSDSPDPAIQVHGVIARDRSEGLYCLVQTATSVTVPPGTVRLPGLDPAAHYHLRPQPPGDAPATHHAAPLPWTTSGVTLTGRTLEQLGVRAPALYPEQLLLIRARKGTTS